MFDKTINVKTLDLSGLSFPISDDTTTTTLVYFAIKNTYGFPLFLKNFKINDVKRDNILVNPIIKENFIYVNLGDVYLVISQNAIVVNDGIFAEAIEIVNDAVIKGDTDITGDLDVTGDTAITGDLEVTGDAQLFENITDSAGNKRFVEGDITMETIEGVTQTYGKWSLSGSHLMIVVCFDIASNTTLSNAQLLFSLRPNDFIYNKITPLHSDNVDRRTCFDSRGNKSINVVLTKTNNLLSVRNVTAFTADADRTFRVQFDLIIDADYE